MNLGPFQLGQQPVITATFVDVAGGVAVATAATFMVHDPAGVETSTSSPNAAITNPTPNVWKFTMPIITVAGYWTIRCKTTTGLNAASESTLLASSSAFTTP